ncbi:MAG TPA: SCO family protein [Caulobacteraceae bacterium]
MAILALAAIFAWRSQVPPAPAPSAIGGPFQLIADNGARVDQRILTGKWSAVYFGYSFCPDVCPTTLAALAQAIAQLGPKAKALQVVFITVDPERDTPAQLRAYLASPSFPKGAIGLTGSEAEIKAVAGAYHVYYSRHQEASGPYSVDHTSIIYLMDPTGRFVRPLATGTPADMARQIAEAMSGR